MRILIALLLLFPAARQTLAQPPGSQTVWRAATEYPATATPGEGLATFARLLNQESAGQIKLEPRYDAPDGLKSAAIPEAVQAGRIEVGDAFAGALAGQDPVFQLSSLPFLATSVDDAWRLYAAAKPAYTRAFAARGQHVLYATPWPASGIWSRDALLGPTALVGLPIRTYDATSTQVLARAGAAAVQLSFADAMPHLQDGSVTAVLSSGDGGAGRRLWEFTRHFMVVGYAMPLSFATVSDAAYQTLPPPQRAAVDAAGAGTEAAQWTALVQRTADNMKTMRMNGVSIEQPDPALAAALAEAGAAVTADWARQAGPDATAVLDAYRK